MSLGPPVEVFVGCAVGAFADARGRPGADQLDAGRASVRAVLPLAINNRLRTGADKGNPTV